MAKNTKDTPAITSRGNIRFLMGVILALFPLQLSGQAGTGLLAPNRMIDWSNAGAGAIPARTTVCATLTSSATPAAVQSALSSCPSGQTVLLAAGTYNWSSSLVTTASNVTLRGAGPTQTILKFTGTSSNCNGLGPVAFCVWNGDSNSMQYSSNVLTWTAGSYAKGATTLTLGGSPGSICGGSYNAACPGFVGNLHVGSLLGINQLDDASDTGNMYMCSGTTNCSQQGVANAWKGRVQTQLVTVTGISGSNVTFSPGLYAPQWASGKTPIAYYSNSAPVTGFGLENLQINTQSMGDIQAMLMFYWATNSWAKNVSYVNNDVPGGAARKHVEISSSTHITIRDSYFYGSSPSSEGYGIDFILGAADSLAENNIFHHMAGPMVLETGEGNIYGHNFATDDYYAGWNGTTFTAPNWNQGSEDHHDAGDMYNLWEGNIDIGFQADDIHGPSFANTAFRNRYSGLDPVVDNGCPAPGCGTMHKTQNTIAWTSGAYDRYDNSVANVLGTSGYHTTYAVTGCSVGPPSVTEFVLGCPTGSYGTDSVVPTSLMRWGNYDTVNAAVRTVTGENGSTASTYPGLASPATSWSSYRSLYLSGTPAFWGTMPFPDIGPDVTGGNIANVGGHAYLNPSANCYLNVLGGTTTGNTGSLGATFDAATCYASTPPPNFTLGITATNGAVSGTNCTAGSYASGTTVGACTATPLTGYSFSSWSSTGSATCSGSGTCGPFSLTSNTTLTATFTLNSWTLTTTTAGTGSGTITGCGGSHNYGSTYTCTVTPSAGSAITSVSGCGGSGTTTFTGTMPNNACTVTATFSNTLATPTFTPPAGTYGAAQAVTISSATTGTTVVSMTEGSNGNASNGDVPSRNAYTNCATGYNGTALTPVGQPVGQLYCTASDKSAAIAAGGPNLGVVVSALSGTGIHPLDNGNGAGGTDSLASITATYGQANQGGCPVGTNVPTFLSGLNLPGSVAAANTTYGLTTASSNFNSSSLEPTKWVVATGDNALYWVRETCQMVNTTSVTGEHLEYDTNYNTSAGDYIGQGIHYNFADSKFYYCPQGCSSWQAMKLQRVPDGTVLTTISWPANHWIYTQFWEHHTSACTHSSGSNCFFYDQMCFKDFTVGGPLTCYNLQDAVSGLTPGGIPVNKSTWTRNEFSLQHQWDVNQASATLMNTVDFDNLVAFSIAPNVFYTTDGSTPTTGSTPYYLPVSVSTNLTLKAIAQQSGFTTSAVGTAAYVISPTNSLTVTAINGSVTGTNCATGNYAVGASIGPCTATPNTGFVFSGWTGTGACSAATGTGTASCTLSTNGSLTASFSAAALVCGDPTQLSPNFSGSYLVPPTTLPMTVGFVSPTGGCTMHYTSDGSTPTCSSTAYPGGNISIASVGTYVYRVIACQASYSPSNVVGGTWVVQNAGVTATKSVGISVQGVSVQ